jgi:hypothetical protein
VTNHVHLSRGYTVFFLGDPLHCDSDDDAVVALRVYWSELMIRVVCGLESALSSALLDLELRGFLPITSGAIGTNDHNISSTTIWTEMEHIVVS